MVIVQEIQAVAETGVCGPKIHQARRGSLLFDIVCCVANIIFPSSLKTRDDASVYTRKVQNQLVKMPRMIDTKTALRMFWREKLTN